MKKTYSIAISPCPNDVYIFAGLILGKVSMPGLAMDFTFLDIEELNNLALGHHSDIVKVSAAAFPGLRSHYEVLSAGGAFGLGVGPMILMNRESFDIRHKILVPGRHTTAHYLLNRYGEPSQPREFLPFDQLYKQLCSVPGTQGVVIHENRFTYQEDGLSLVVDLGQQWFADTSLPLPLGLIVSNISLGIKAPLTELIRASLAWSKENTQAALNLCRNYSQNMQDSVMLSHINTYVNEFSSNMEDEGKRALQTLLGSIPA